MNYLNPIIQKIFSFHNFINLIISGQEVVFQCRDEGPLRVNVKWSRGNGAEGLPFPPGTRDFNGRLEIPDIKVSIDWLSSFFILKTFLIVNIWIFNLYPFQFLMFQLKHTGTYVCQAVGYTKTYPGATRSAYLLVKSKYIALSNIPYYPTMQQYVPEFFLIFNWLKIAK